MKNKFKGWGSGLLNGIIALALSTMLMAASAPFDPDETKPADSDVVSQYPAIERSFRDIIESWLVIDHDKTIGGHDQISFVDQASDPTYASGVIGVWNNAGVLSTRVASGAITVLSSIPAGTVVDYAGASAPTGWLLAYGQCVSRTTYAALFTALSTLYDDGCSGTEFGIPDTRGRVTAGDDDMGTVSANRLTGLTNGVNGDTLGATGGLESFVLSEANLAAHDHAMAHSHTIAHTHLETRIQNGSLGFTGGGPFAESFNSLNTGGTSTGSSGGSSAANTSNAGSGTAKGHIQPTIILMKIIKT